MSQKIKIRLDKLSNKESVNFGDTLIDGEFFGEKEQECIDFNRELKSMREAEEDEVRNEWFGRGRKQTRGEHGNDARE